MLGYVISVLHTCGCYAQGWKGWKEELHTGPIMSVYSREAADWEGSGYGPILETPCVRKPAYCLK